MLETIVRREIIFYVMAILVLLGVFAKLISNFTVRKMVKAASQIHKSNHKLMRLIKAKFEHASMVSDKVQNVDAFVDKYIYEYKVLGIRIEGWRTLPKKILLLVVVLGVFAILESHRLEGIGDMLFGYLRWTAMFVAVLFLLYFMADEKSQMEVAKNYMVEYLANVCMHRYAKANQVAVEPESEDIPEEEVEETIEEEEKEDAENEREMQIRAILEEFLA